MFKHIHKISGIEIVKCYADYTGLQILTLQKLFLF
jgi:hypothetical protein